MKKISIRKSKGITAKATWALSDCILVGIYAGLKDAGEFDALLSAMIDKMEVQPSNGAGKTRLHDFVVHVWIEVMFSIADVFENETLQTWTEQEKKHRPDRKQKS